MYIGQEVKFIGAHPNDTFNRRTIYHISGFSIAKCGCNNKSLIALTEYPVNNGHTGCSTCHKENGGVYWNSDIFRGAINLSNNIRIL